MTAIFCSGYSLVVEIISKPNFCLDRILAKRLVNFLAQKINVNFDRVGIGIKGASPNFFDQRFFEYKFAFSLNQHQEDLILTWCKYDFLVLTQNFLLHGMDHDIS